MESRSNRSAAPTSRTASTYNGFTFAVPPTPQLLRSADTSAPDLELGARPNETSSSGTLSTPYSSLIATPISGAGPITAQSRNEPRTAVSPASQGSSSMVLRTASSRPPFAFFPPPESNHHAWTNPPTPLPQDFPSKAEVSSVGDEDQDEKFIRPTDTDVVPTAPGSSLSQSLHMVGEDDSPYPEVRASVANTDDPDMPTLTFRMWFIGITLCLVRTSLALFFSLRWPSPWISDTLVIIVAYPFGKALDRLLPFRYWTFPRALPLVGGLSFGLNPGPFNIKEHTLVFIMSFISDPPIYGFMLIVTAEKHYGTPLGTGFEFLFLFGTQLACLGSVAFGRSLFIYPASVIWPHSLVRSTLLNTLHADEETRNGQMTRYRLFIICAAAAFLYCFLPAHSQPHIDNVVVNQLFGTVTGLGMGLLTFDWNQISYLGSPMIIPWWASVNIFLGFVGFLWILAPILYYTDVWKMGHLPMTGYSAYDRFALPYDIHRVLTPTMELNVTAYEEYSPVYLPVTFAVTYLLAFMLVTSVIVHTILNEGHAIIAAVRRTKVEEEDIHARLMRRYPEVLSYYYMGISVVGLSMLIGAIKLQEFDVPIWSIFLAMLLALIYIIPCAYVYAKSGTAVPINLLAELIPGALLPGRPFANMVFKICAIDGFDHSLTFMENLKLGHYLKVPPYAIQLVAIVISTCMQIVVKNALFASVPDICDPNQPHNLVCPGYNVFFTASIVWGLIGTSRQFGKGSVYHFQVYGLMIGAVLPVIIWSWKRKYPKSVLRYFNISVFLSGPTSTPPATGINYTSFFIVAFLFQYLLRVRCHRVWARFNYILACALEAGTGVAVIVIFLALQLPKDGRISLDWWGNTVWANTADALGVPYFPTDPDTGF